MNIKNRLKIMMFFQYFIWGSWLATFGAYLFNTLHFSGVEVSMIFSTKGLAALITPFIIGIIADKFLQAKYLYMLCHSVCAIALFYAASVNNSAILFWVMLGNALAFMPTIALSNSISYMLKTKIILFFNYFMGFYPIKLSNRLSLFYYIHLFYFSLALIFLKGYYHASDFRYSTSR